MLGLIHLGWQAWRASFPLCADRANPWVYAQTAPDLLNLVEKVRSVARAGQGDATLIKVITAGEHPLTVHRLVSHGSSFGANPLQQTIGLGRAGSVATLEIYWPTSRTTQVFHDVAVKQAIEVTEFAEGYRKLNWAPVPVRRE